MATPKQTRFKPGDTVYSAELPWIVGKPIWMTTATVERCGEKEVFFTEWVSRLGKRVPIDAVAATKVEAIEKLLEKHKKLRTDANDLLVQRVKECEQIEYALAQAKNP